MNSRLEEILLATVEEYINGGEPVSSKLLFKRHDFGIRPASIRSELNALEDGGYLSQPYTSGGRVPTDTGYEFYIEYLKQKPQRDTSPSRVLFNLADTMLGGEFDDFVEGMADELHSLSVGFTLRDGRTARSGLDQLFERLEGGESEVFRGIARELEALDERIEKYVEKDSARKNGLQIFIGEKNPLIRNENLSTFCDFYETANEQSFFLMAISPKRADYEKSVRAFRGLKSALQKK
jgi:transcriptional regulator of heat shock response